GTPPAFVLSQDQTLVKVVCSSFAGLTFYCFDVLFRSVFKDQTYSLLSDSDFINITFTNHTVNTFFKKFFDATAFFLRQQRRLLIYQV
ncbi:hypothetical protein, partial [Lederbergia lenta]|uniref:hypothetical protein n=1 Tax=Lederbergia lenta TaxID=1467 RepID=UPI002040AAF2